MLRVVVRYWQRNIFIKNIINKRIMSIESVVCPNCGANTTNVQNCEYCGSLFVRFAKQGIDISKTSYAKNIVIRGLVDELRKNLQYQSQNAIGTEVSTEICTDDIGMSVFSPANKAWTWMDGNIIDGINSREHGLIITFRFFDIIHTIFNIRPVTYQSQLKIQDEYKREFRRLDCYPLLLKHTCSDEADYLRWTYTEYAIDFGDDAEGAAQLISDILVKVYGCSANGGSVSFRTIVGESNIESYRDKVNNTSAMERRFEKDMSNQDKLMKIIGVVSLVVFVIYCIGAFM